MTQKTTNCERIRLLYDAFNDCDLDSLIALIAEDVDWPDGDERLHGREALGRYWLHLWARIHTHDKVVGVTDLGPERAAVRISQVVRSLDGKIISTGKFEHIYQFRHGLAQRMDLRIL